MAKKNVLVHIYILCIALLLGSCTEDMHNVGEQASLSARYLNASPSFVKFNSPLSSEQEISVISMHSSWELSDMPKWLTANPNAGNGNQTVRIYAEENLSGDTARVAILNLKSTSSDWQFCLPVTVSQIAAKAFISPEREKINFSGRSNTETIEVASNCNWETKCNESWIKAERQGNKLLVSVDAIADSENGRFGYVQLVGKTSANILVEQDPANLKASTDTLYFDNVAGTYSLSVESDLNWTASTSCSWIQVSPAVGGVGNADIEITVTPNTSTSTREGSVYLRMHDQVIKIPIVQRGYYMETETQQIEFGSHGGVINLSLMSNDNWDVEVFDADWLTISSSSGNGSENIIMTATDNPTLNSRESSMAIKSAYCPTLNISIRQNPRYLTLSSKSIAFFGKGGTSEPIYIDADAQYKWEKKGDWFNASITDDVLIVSAAENNTGAWRQGSITFTVTDLKEGELIVTVPVEQAISGVKIEKGEYEDDGDWNDDKSEWKVVVTIIEYKEDEDWSNNPEKKESSINHSDYSDDEDWTNKE